MCDLHLWQLEQSQELMGEKKRLDTVQAHEDTSRVLVEETSQEVKSL